MQLQMFGYLVFANGIKIEASGEDDDFDSVMSAFACGSNKVVSFVEPNGGVDADEANVWTADGTFYEAENGVELFNEWLVANI